MILHVLFEELTCGECSAVFLVNYGWYLHCANHQKEIYCPAGHTNCFEVPKEDENPVKTRDELKVENDELKRRLFQALHDAEQGEAKKSEDAKTTKRKAV